MTNPKSPARVILEHLETHDNLTAREASELCQLATDNYARRILEELEQRGLVRRDLKAHKAASVSPMAASFRTGASGKPTVSRPAS